MDGGCGRGRVRQLAVHSGYQECIEGWIIRGGERVRKCAGDGAVGEVDHPEAGSVGNYGVIDACEIISYICLAFRRSYPQRSIRCTISDDLAELSGGVVE